MTSPSQFLRRALLADAIFSGVSAAGLTFGAGAFASLLNLPEALLQETGLFLIAYTILVGWLGTRPAVPRALVMLVVVGNAAWTLASIALLFSGAVSPNLLGEIVVVAQAIATGVFAELQYIGLRRSGGGLARHCEEPTGRANARPMTRSAKQSISPRKERMDCFVAALLAMTAQLNVNAAIMPISVRAIPATSIGTRLLPA
jgi:hypothetical protein